MNKITSKNGTVIKYYSSPKECTMDRYAEFQKQLVIESGIGCTAESIANHYRKINAFLLDGKINEAITENNNAFYALNSVLNSVSYYGIAFACLVATIGTEIRSDLTAEGLLETSEIIKGLEITQQEIEDIVEDVKKKS